MERDISPANATLPALPSVGQGRTLAALLSATFSEAAKAAKVDRPILHRWLSDDGSSRQPDGPVRLLDEHQPDTHETDGTVKATQC